MKRLITFIQGIMLMMLSNYALAATVGGTMAVSAGVVASCTVSTSPVNFGNNVSYAGTGTIYATGSVDATCSNGVQYTIALDGGLNSFSFVRRMVDGTGTYTSSNGHMLGYTLMQPDNATRWGDCDTTGVCGPWNQTSSLILSSTGTGTLQNHTVNASISSAGIAGLSQVLPGNFSDTVNVTVSY